MSNTSSLPNATNQQVTENLMLELTLRRKDSQMPKRAKKRDHKEPLWRGPRIDGISFSLLHDFLVCRERFRLKVIEGKVEPLGFNHAIEYGSMFHECEEARFKGENWKVALKKYVTKLMSKYQSDSNLKAIEKWTAILKGQYPEYVKHYEGSNHVKKYLLQEQTFSIPYTLPSGRYVVLRGMIDGIVRTQDGQIAIQENKTKGKIDRDAVGATIFFNLQAMLYYVASREIITQNCLYRSQDKRYNSDHKNPWQAWPTKKTSAILYNVIRRPLSDHFAIRQRKTENTKQFYSRVTADIQENPDHYFMRWLIPIHNFQLEAFKRKIFHPILESLCDWWEHIEIDPFNPWRQDTGHPVSPLHYQMPWGVYNSLSGGFRGDYYDYYTTGSDRSLTTISTLFPELE